MGVGKRERIGVVWQRKRFRRDIYLIGDCSEQVNISFLHVWWCGQLSPCSMKAKQSNNPPPPPQPCQKKNLKLKKKTPKSPYYTNKNKGKLPRTKNRALVNFGCLCTHCDMIMMMTIIIPARLEFLSLGNGEE